MHVKVNEAGVADAQRMDELDKLDVVAPDHKRVERALDGIGSVEGDHVWIAIDWLASQGYPGDAAWRKKFDEMILYAQKAGWTRPDGTVRAHVVFG